MTKKEELTAAIEAFMKDENPDTMLDMMCKVVSATKQGSGLIWPEVKEIIDSCFKNKKESNP